jgi:hypothetical protein
MIVNTDFPVPGVLHRWWRIAWLTEGSLCKIWTDFFLRPFPFIALWRKKKVSCVTFHWICTFPRRINFTLYDIRTRIISNKFSQFITPGWNAESLWLPGRLDVEWMLPVSIFLFELISLYERAYGHSSVCNAEYKSGKLVQNNTKPDVNQELSLH